MGNKMCIPPKVTVPNVDISEVETQILDTPGVYLPLVVNMSVETAMRYCCILYSDRAYMTTLVGWLTYNIDAMESNIKHGICHIDLVKAYVTIVKYKLALVRTYLGHTIDPCDIHNTLVYRTTMMYVLYRDSHTNIKTHSRWADIHTTVTKYLGM
jgi:hypothetical protein